MFLVRMQSKILRAVFEEQHRGLIVVHVSKQRRAYNTNDFHSMNHVSKPHIMYSKAQKSTEHKSLPRSMFQKH